MISALHRRLPPILFGTLLIFLVLVWPSISFSAGGSPSFAPAVSYSVGINPFVVASDFNGDGRTDLATANAGSNNVSILLGVGDGTFSSVVEYRVGKNPVHLTTGDLNKDGKIDIATANETGYTISVLLGAGNGTFATYKDYPVAAYPMFVTAGDFNGDDKTDLCFVDTATTSTSFIPGVGDGTFGSVVKFLSDPGCQRNAGNWAEGDFNKDGYTDLASYLNSYVNILLGVEDGSSRLAEEYQVGTGYVSLTTGDFNGDGRADIATADKGRNDVTILSGAGDGTFGGAVKYGVGTNPVLIATGDFNGDGKTDLATANTGNNSVSILINTTPPGTTFSSTTKTSSGTTTSTSRSGC